MTKTGACFILMCLIISVKSYSQISVQVTEYNQTNNTTMIRLSSEGLMKSVQQMRLRVQLEESGGKILCQKEEIIILKRNLTSILIDGLIQEDQIKIEDVQTGGDLAIEQFRETSRTLIIHLIDTNGSVIDSAVNYSYSRQVSFEQEWSRGILTMSLIGAKLDTVIYSSLRSALLLECDSLPNYLAWSTYSSDGKAYFDLESLFKMGYAPKSITSFIVMDSSDLIIDNQLISKTASEWRVLDSLPSLNKGINEVSAQLIKWKGFKMLRVNKPVVKIGGQVWLNGYSSNERLAQDSMPLNGTDAGSNLNLVIGGLPLKIASLESSQDGFMGAMNQRTISVDFEKLHQMLPGVKKKQSLEGLELQKRKLIAPDGLGVANQISNPLAPKVDSVLSATDAVKDTISELRKNAVNRVDSLQEILEFKEDSIKDQLAQLRTTRQKILNKLQYVEEFSIGRVNPAYSRFTINGMPLDGISLSLRKKRAAIAGFTGYTVPDVMNMHKNTLDRWRLRGLKYEKQLTEEQSITFSGLHAFQTLSNELFRRENAVTEVGHSFKSMKTGLQTNLEFSLATSEILRDERVTAFLERKVDHAIHAHVGYEIKKLQTLLGVEYEEISDEYFTAGNPFLRRAYTEYAAYLNGTYFKGKLNLKLKWLNRKQIFSNNSSSNTTGEFDVRIKNKTWYMQGSYKPLAVVGGFLSDNGGWQYSNMEMNLLLLRVNKNTKLNQWNISNSFIYVRNQSTSNNVLSSSLESFQASLLIRKKRMFTSFGVSVNRITGSQLNQNPEDLVFASPLTTNTSGFGMIRYTLKKQLHLTTDFNSMQGKNLNGSFETRNTASMGAVDLLHLTGH